MGPQGLIVLGITGDPHLAMEDFRDTLDIQMPLLHDPANESFFDFFEAMAFPTGAYPHHFVVGVDGTIIYSNNRYDADALREVVEGELD